jgi:hypothetical protein
MAKSSLCATCEMPLSGHTSRMLRRCRGSALPVGGEQYRMKRPRRTVGSVVVRATIRQPRTVGRVEVHCTLHTAQLAVKSDRHARPQKRLYDVPEDVRVKVREYKYRQRHGGELTDELREALREYEKIRWRQMPQRNRSRESRRSNMTRAARERKRARWLDITAALAVAARYPDEWEAAKAAIREADQPSE